MKEWVILSVLLSAVFVLFVTPALLFSTPTKEQRYHHINQVLEKIDYKSSGTLLEEGYDDNGPSPLNPAYFKVVFEGSETFEILKSRMLAVVEKECELDTPTQFACRNHEPSVALVIRENGDTSLTLTETGAGL